MLRFLLELEKILTKLTGQNDWDFQVLWRPLFYRFSSNDTLLITSKPTPQSLCHSIKLQISGEKS
jgi:hypothetical protein